MKKLLLGSIFFSLFLVGCSSSEPKEEVIVDETITTAPVPVEMSKEVMPKPLLDKR